MHFDLLLFIIQLFVPFARAQSQKPMCVMYLTGQHNVVPDQSAVSKVTHVELAFLQSNIFNQANISSWPLFTTVDKVRSQFTKGTQVMIAIGGWGDTAGFSIGAKSDDSRKLFAQNVKKMIDETGADGIDVDWEYPGGNGEDYKQIPNSEKAWEIDAYPKLLAEIRTAIGTSKLISVAVPGLPRDMLAFTDKTVSLINEYVDFWNIMTYDLMNRRDNVTKHHTGVTLSLDAIDTYISRGVPASKSNLGFAFYVKYFRMDPNSTCSAPTGCKTALMEDPTTGADLGQAGAFSWHDAVPNDLAPSLNKALTQGSYDTAGGGYSYLDMEEHIWWSFDTPDAILRKFPAIVKNRNLGGVFAWGLGEDASEFEHFQALTKGFEEWVGDGDRVQRSAGNKLEL